MSVLITNPVAGAYTATYNAVSLGMMNDDGFVLSAQPLGQDINDTDQFGGTLIEGIYRGMSFGIRCRTKEWVSGMQGALQAFGNFNSNPAPSFALGVIGRKYTSVAQSLVLTSTAGTPAANSPASLTAAQAVIRPNVNIDWNFTSRVREVPLDFLCIPYAQSGSNIPWSTA